MKLKLLVGAALAPVLAAGAAHAQDARDEGPITAVEDIIVTGQPIFRNRTEDVVPTLSYDLQYFQRFEPLTVGDALRRVPSVTFLSDVLESDGARLRGLDSGYTQILINGDQVPGAGDDRSFFVDRIPAELIERVEVVRAPSARRSGDAVAGAINIVLRDAYTLDGGYIRAGGRYYDDGEWRQSLGLTWGGEVGPGRLIASFDMQDRYNPKNKFSERYDDLADAEAGVVDNVEVQDDTRDGTDWSFNGAYELPVFGGNLSLTGVYVRTEREEVENSYEYPDGDIQPDNLEVYTPQLEDILSENLSLRADLEVPMAGGETRVRLGYASYTDDISGVETEYAYLEDGLPFPDVDVIESELTDLQLEDTEWTLRLQHKRDTGFGDIEFGVDLTEKERTTLIQSAEFEDDSVADFPAPPPAFVYDPFEIADGGDSTIEETRIEPYVVLSGRNGALTWEAGVRYEMTDVSIEDRTVPATTGNDYGEWLPSASFRYALSDTDRLIVSAGRTIRRPNFNYISPALLEEEVGDSDFLGNPDLKPETAWGFDVGFERRLGRRGVVGINAFYRDITDLIEFVNTGDEGSEGPGTFIYTVDNVGDGTVWGLEFDLSTPLDVVGLPDTGVFLNYSWLDSEVEDFIGTRRFNGQSDYAFSAGFTHDIPTWQAAFGATYYSQGDARDRVLAEEVLTTYGDNLEIFVERSFGQNVVLRLTGSNLLDASKDETFDKFDNVADQIARDYDEYELETEAAGPVYQLVMRVAF